MSLPNTYGQMIATGLEYSDWQESCIEAATTQLFYVGHERIAGHHE